MSRFTQNIFDLGFLAGRHTHAAYHVVSGHVLSLSKSPLTTVSDLPKILLDLPPRYRAWWIELVSEDPVHVVVETILIAFVLYMFWLRRSVGSPGGQGQKLTEAEKEDLIREWVETERAALVPALESGGSRTSGPNVAHGSDRWIGAGVVVERVSGSHMTVRLPPSSSHKNGSNPRKVSGWERKTVLNFATHDFLGVASSDDGPEDAAVSAFGESPGASPRKRSIRWMRSVDTPNDAQTSLKPSAESVKGAARAALLRYGCGSCGPRGFYGTIDAHLDLEDAIADHMGTEGAIMYSDGASAATSTVAAFAKRGDLLVVDEGVYEALGTGVTLSRANVVYFRHNDVGDLKAVLEDIRETDRRLGRTSSDQRRFIVVEGLYKNRGTVAPLDEIAKLKAEFSYRLIVDESFSFGTMGRSGRGALDHYGLSPMVDAEIIIIGLENALGSIGGVCVGSEEVVDHQRLSGAGYCFSASAPPFLASAAISSLERIKRSPDMIERTKKNRDAIYRTLSGSRVRGIVPERMQVVSDELSSIVILELSGKEADASIEDQIGMLDRIAERCLSHGLAIVSTGGHVGEKLHDVPLPAIRLTVSAVHSYDDIVKAVKVLKESIINVLGE